jgi:hypothetical protein
MTPRDVIEQMDAGRRATTLVLQRLDVGLDPVAVIREVSPTLSPVAVDAARRLVELTAFHFASTAMVLTGLVPDALLEGAEIPEPPARPTRRTPDEIATDWLLRDLTAPPATVATGATPDMSPQANPSLGLEPPVTGPEGDSL